MRGQISNINFVSTYSRPKAAGIVTTTYLERVESFNSQPPEGGWFTGHKKCPPIICFNSQPPEGGWQQRRYTVNSHFRFNSQPPEGGWLKKGRHWAAERSFNSQPPEGGWLLAAALCWNSSKFQLTAARRRLVIGELAAVAVVVFQLTAARRRLDWCQPVLWCWWMFQLTAARRRLGLISRAGRGIGEVSTHSRPKAAGRTLYYLGKASDVSTHSRAKAAGLLGRRLITGYPVSTHSRAKAAGLRPLKLGFFSRRFNSQPREGGWQPRPRPPRCKPGFNSQPREGGWFFISGDTPVDERVSTHSRAKAAGRFIYRGLIGIRVSTHSRAKAAGTPKMALILTANMFQLTAARRRLGF